MSEDKCLTKKDRKKIIGNLILMLMMILMFLTPCISRSGNKTEGRLAEVVVNKDNIPITFEKFPAVINVKCIGKYLYLISEDEDKEKMFIRELTKIRPIECKGD